MASTELMIEFRMRMQSQMIRVYCSSDREKLLKFEAEGREFAKFLSSRDSNLTRGMSEFEIYVYIGVYFHAQISYRNLYGVFPTSLYISLFSRYHGNHVISSFKHLESVEELSFESGI